MVGCNPGRAEGPSAARHRMLTWGPTQTGRRHAGDHRSADQHGGHREAIRDDPSAGRGGARTATDLEVYREILPKLDSMATCAVRIRRTSPDWPPRSSSNPCAPLGGRITTRHSYRPGLPLNAPTTNRAFRTVPSRSQLGPLVTRQATPRIKPGGEGQGGKSQTKALPRGPCHGATRWEYERLCCLFPPAEGSAAASSEVNRRSHRNRLRAGERPHLTRFTARERARPKSGFRPAKPIALLRLSKRDPPTTARCAL